MQLITLTLAFLTPFTTALPAPSPLNLSLRNPQTTTTNTNVAAINTTAKRACPRVAPLSTPRLNLLNRPDLSPPLTQTQTVVFALPSPASSLPGPCTLRAVFPPHWEVFDSSVQAGGEPLAVNVIAADGPAEGALVGVVKFAGSGAGEEGEERVVTVNSFACRERMAYRFELAGVGEVGFVNGFDQGLGVEGGLEMGWGC
jgi:hypothetical protein